MLLSLISVLHRTVTLLLEVEVTFTKKHYLPAKVGLAASNIYFFLLPFKHLFSILGHAFILAMVQILAFDCQVVSGEKSEKLLPCTDSCPSLLKLKMIIE